MVFIEPKKECEYSEGTLVWAMQASGSDCTRPRFYAFMQTVPNVPLSDTCLVSTDLVRQ